MNEDKFKKIDDINKTLSEVNKSVYTMLSNLDGKSQAYVDKICIKVSEKCNKAIEDKRTDLIKFLHNYYKASNETVTMLEPLVTLNPVDLPSVITSVKKIIEIVTGPYYQAIEFMTVLTPKLQELMTNIALLALIPTELPSILDVNYDKLKIKMQPITMANIITGDPKAKEEAPNPDTSTPPYKRQITFNSYNELLSYPTEGLKDGATSKVIFNLSEDAKQIINKYHSDGGYNHIINTYVYNKKMIGKNGWANIKGDMFKTTEDITKWINESNTGTNAIGKIYEVSSIGNFVLCTSMSQNLEQKYIYEPKFVNLPVTNGTLKPEDYIYVDENGIPVTY